MKRFVPIFIAFCLASIITTRAFSFNIIFPEFYTYSEMQQSGDVFSSYLIDMLIDTGLKYGVTIGLGFKEYNITSLQSNVIGLDSLKLYINPVDTLNVGYFMGKNVTLGNTELGYQGFQFHQEAGLEYIGFKDINGTGLEFFMDFMDSMLEPHFYVYEASDTNLVNMDTVWYLKMEHYKFEGYFGLNDISIPSALKNKTLAYRFGFFVKTEYGKIDFMMGLFAPDTLVGQMPTADSIYLNVTEHIVVANFEQTLTLFTRPSSYNGFVENISNDFDIYLAVGPKFDDFGTGLENTILFAANYSLTDRAGLYIYLTMDSLMYKLGVYDTLAGNAFSSRYGGYISISGKI